MPMKRFKFTHGDVFTNNVLQISEFLYKVAVFVVCTVDDQYKIRVYANASRFEKRVAGETGDVEENGK